MESVPRRAPKARKTPAVQCQGDKTKLTLGNSRQQARRVFSSGGVLDARGSGGSKREGGVVDCVEEDCRQGPTARAIERRQKARERMLFEIASSTGAKRKKAEEHAGCEWWEG